MTNIRIRTGFFTLRIRARTRLVLPRLEGNYSLRFHIKLLFLCTVGEHVVTTCCVTPRWCHKGTVVQAMMNGASQSWMQLASVESHCVKLSFG